MILDTRAVEPFFKNGYVLGCETTREAVVIDPGDEVDDLLAFVSRERLAVRFILLTHAHFDHITGVGRAKDALGAPVGLHRDDLLLYEAAPDQGRMFGFTVAPPPTPDFFYSHRQVILFGGYEVRVHHTPGHSPGGVCLEVKASASGSQAPRLFVGDTLFAGSIGRTDLPGGDLGTLMTSIREVLLAFPDQSEVYSGHGPVTTIGEERRGNPFLVH